MAAGYKKYMKKNQTKDYGLLKLFIISFFGMLLVFTFLIKTLTPSVDVSIGGDRPEPEMDNTDEMKKFVDGRLTMIQDEDQGKNFSDLMKQAEDIKPDTTPASNQTVEESVSEAFRTPAADPVYKVFIGTYTSAEQAKVARDIIVESGSNLKTIVKFICYKNYNMKVRIFKKKKN